MVLHGRVSSAVQEVPCTGIHVLLGDRSTAVSDGELEAELQRVLAAFGGFESVRTVDAQFTRPK